MGRRKLPGTVFYSASGGRWVVQLDAVHPVSGERKRWRRYALDEATARRKLSELREEAKVGQPKQRTKGNSITVAQWLEHWRDTTLQASDRAQATKAMYANMATQLLLPSLGDVRLAAFTPSQADAWLIRMRGLRKRNGKPYASGSLRNAFNCLSAALDGAVRDRIIMVNPLTALDRPSGEVATPVNVTSAKDVDRLLNYLHNSDVRIKPMVFLVALTGCRVGEARGLTWADVDLSAGRATFRRSSPDTLSTKTRKARTVTLLPELVAVLKAHRKQQAAEQLVLASGWRDNEGRVFTTATGEVIEERNAQRDLRNLLSKLGIPTSRPWHSLRHGLGSRLLAGGMPAHEVQAILGHSSIRVTIDTYGHVEPAVSVERLAAALRKAT